MTTPEHDENDNRVSLTVDRALLTRAMQLAPGCRRGSGWNWRVATATATGFVVDVEVGAAG